MTTIARPAAQRLRADRDAIMRALQLLHEPGAVSELRVLDLPNGLTAAGYFDDITAMVDAAERYSGKGGVYTLLNEVDPSLLARYANRMQERPKHTTGDRDIRRRRWLLGDFDPTRPSGIPATEDEHAGALARMAEVREWLTSRGWPAPLSMDSGNGGALLYRIDLPNDDAALRVVERCLAALGFRFDDAAVTIDQSVKNASRLTRLAGTVNCKGDGTPDRPHRLARIVDSPEVVQPVPTDLLESLAASLPDNAAKVAATPSGKALRDELGVGATDLDAWIAQHGLQVARIGPWQDGRKFVLATCPWDNSHTDGAAFIVEFANGARAAGCLHNSCRGKRWQDLRALYEPEHDQRERAATTAPTITTTTAPITTPRGPSERPWPDPPDPVVYRGLAGELVAAIAPHTEADPAGVLVNVVVAFGNAVGDGPHMLVGATTHPAREYAVVVGKSSKARKGESLNPVRALFEQAAPDWANERIASGLSTGEGLIHEVRDAVEKLEPIKVKGKVVGYETVIADEGEADKRLLVIEPEFARVLRVMSRQGNTLESVLRDAWDRGNLRVLTRSNPLRATGAHISLIAHVTVDELRRELSDISIANGFANRMLWLCVRRSKDLPEPVPFIGEVVDRLAAQLATAISRARAIGRMERDAGARAMWREVYSDLAAEREGLAGALLARAEAHVLRLSLVYALLDGSSVVTSEHLLAALALWEYVESCVEFTFGDATGDPIADTILAALRQNGGLTRTQINDLLGRNVSSDRIARALQALLAAGKARTAQQETAGRPRETWTAC